jgi:hypothetical protein
MTVVNPELIRGALAHIPATLPRDEWARVAMAIKSEFPDTTGLDLFTEWSATADGYDSKATRSTWRSVKAGGAVGIGTLLHLAKEHGFTLPKDNHAATPPSPEVLAQRERDRKADQVAEKARTDAAHAQAATEAAALWSAGSEAGSSQYLERKGVQPYGVRFAPDGWLLVPVQDTAGKLWNVQRIAPEKPTNGCSDKLFLKGGCKSGLMHWIDASAAGGQIPGIQGIPDACTKPRAARWQWALMLATWCMLQRHCGQSFRLPCWCWLAMMIYKPLPTKATTPDAIRRQRRPVRCMAWLFFLMACPMVAATLTTCIST